MTPPEQQLYERLAVFVGGCTLEAAEAVANPNGWFSSSLLDCMGALVDKSLLQRLNGFAGEPRNGLLETIREFALEQLVASAQADEIRRRHVDYFVKPGEQAAPELLVGPQHVSWIRRLGQERHNSAMGQAGQP